ncbi:glycosyltransferase (plasmid) [Salipiger sp. H15]|uniref:Glycosyltransferase n=1 Tax=Alloyangia sp. H15 TaxID=3029062 RepID=A0AAU8ARQ9_9RHOB
MAFASTGRAELLGQTLLDLQRQIRVPDRVILSLAGRDDVDRDALGRSTLPVEALIGDRGLTRQRNTVLDALRDEDLVLFLDDDFVMAQDYLARLEQLFSERPDVCVATGTVIADGINNAGLSADYARHLLGRRQDFAADAELEEVNNAYGCNMAFRCAPIRRHALRFDENLPLYGWLEDVDFCRRVAAHGLCVRAPDLRGVHLGVKGGRQSGLRFGYSQVANPVYLIQRATMRPSHALALISRNIMANVAKSLLPEPWVDRRGRLRGNALALVDLLRRRSDPRRILDLGGGHDGRS